MAAPSIEQVIEGIEARLQTIVGLRTAFYVPDQVNPPEAVVGVPPIPNYHATFAHGNFVLEPTVTILVSKAYDRAGQMALASYADPASATSIHQAIEGDRTLGGLPGVDCIVVDFRPLLHEEVGALGYYGGVFTLKVIARGV